MIGGKKYSREKRLKRGESSSLVDEYGHADKRTDGHDGPILRFLFVYTEKRVRRWVVNIVSTMQVMGHPASCVLTKTNCRMHDCIGRRGVPHYNFGGDWSPQCDIIIPHSNSLLFHFFNRSLPLTNLCWPVTHY